MKSRCLETRRSGHLVMRRHEKPNGRRVRTMELPWTLWLRVRPTVMKAMPGYVRTEAARDRIAEIKRLGAEGNKSEWIAATVGVTPQRVRQILRKKSQ